MTLQALSHLDRSTANSVLAATAISTSADPGITDRSWLAHYESEIAAVSAEIRKALALKPGDHSQKAQIRFDEYLAREIERRTFSSTEQANEALARAGQSGLLSPAVYAIEQPKPFVEQFRKFGFKKEVVKDVIRRADEYQHLMTDGDDTPERDAISLFLKRAAKAGNDAHWLLVQTFRRGSSLIVQSAWRVFPDDIDLRNANSPLDMLRAFAETYGVPGSVGGREQTKFVECQTFDGVMETDVEWHLPKQNTEYFSSFSHKKRGDKLMVGIAFCIDLNAYAAALRNHGFNL